MPLPVKEARRLRRLLQKRLAQFEARLAALANDTTAAGSETTESAPGESPGQGDVQQLAAPDAQQLEREARALTSLMKALQAAAELEQESRAHAVRSRRARQDEEADAAIRRRLAQQLEALCAQTRPPHRRCGAE